MIPLSVPLISGNEWKYMKECLDTGWVSSAGGYVNRFEKIIAEYLGIKHAVAVINGTSALHLSLLACGVRPGDEVVVPALTFIAPVNTIRYCGAEPVFMDCNAETLCMDTDKVIRFIENNTEQKKDGYSYNKNSGRRIRAVIPVHVFGHPVHMGELVNICNTRNISIVEDATESLGSEYNGKKTGSFGKIGCFSFNGNKMITTGGGGMIITDDGNLADRIRHLSTQARKDLVEYDHDDLGYNYRLSNVHAAMGVAQMEKVEEFIRIKRQNAVLYRKALSGIKGITFLWEKPWARSNFWFYTIKVPKNHKKSLMNYLISREIQVRPIWKLIHTLPMYKGCETYAIDNAEEAYETCLNLPCSVDLQERDIGYIVDSIIDYFRKL